MSKLTKQTKLFKQVRDLQKHKEEVDAAPVFSLNGLICMGKCVYVYDGDTAHFVIKSDNKWVKFKCRAYGYNTAEMRGGTAETKAQARREKKALADQILNDIVELHFGEFDKYGRPLVTIYKDGLNINEWMVESGNARPYLGKGTKR